MNSRNKQINNIVKLCVGCQQVKPLEGGYYKTKNCWHKYCKKCHNAKRNDYPPSKYTYIRKPTGFKKLDEELQKKIIYDLYVGINFKDIYRKYKETYPNLKYHSLIRWDRLNQIPEYSE